MKIHLVIHFTSTDGTLQHWFATKKEANQKEAEILAEDPEATITRRVIDFPERKAEVVSWLNANFDTDNG